MVRSRTVCLSFAKARGGEARASSRLELRH
jgi:hypothetical protein